MNKRKCLGCGVELQYEKPEQPGYIPALKRGEARLCQRCYQIRHYGKLKRESVNGDQVHSSVMKAIKNSDVILLVVDLFDPEGSLPLHWDEYFTLPVVLAINKADLLPAKTPWDEVEDWFTALWKRRFPSVPLVATLSLSAKKKGKDSREQMNKLKEQLKGKTVAILGAANVGKTSLLTTLLDEEKKSVKGGMPTVSGFPGTTQGTSSWLIRSLDLKIFDTPGFFPGTRVGDQLPAEDAGRLLPETRFQVKLWELPPEGGVLFAALTAVWNLSPTPRTLVFFTAEKTPLHRSRGQKALSLMEEAPKWLQPFNLQASLGEFIEKKFTVQPGEDLYFSGLGWVAVKKEPAVLKVRVPTGMEVGVRPSLIGKKTN